MDKFIIMPDGTYQHDATGVIPESCPVDPINQYDRLIDLMSYREVEDTQGLSTTAFLRYCEMRTSGESHRIAVVLASRRFPGVKSDSIFNEGRFSGDSGKLGVEQLWLKQQAESRGVSTTGKWYSKGLASYPGDPTAWVDSMSDVRRVAAAKNMTVHGYVEQKGHEVEPMPDIDIDPKIVHAETREVMAAHEGARYQDVYERIREVRSGKSDPNPLRVRGLTDAQRDQTGAALCLCRCLDYLCCDPVPG